jgi:hypothetical protein
VNEAIPGNVSQWRIVAFFMVDFRAGIAADQFTVSSTNIAVILVFFLAFLLNSFTLKQNTIFT